MCCGAARMAANTWSRHSSGTFGSNSSPMLHTNTQDGFRFILADTTWLLIRFSGTEPVLRIYTESDTPARVEKLLEAGRKIAGV